MPQLDKLTFLSQSFWTFVIFFTFYFTVLHTYLPRLARILKLRRKKLLSGSSGAGTYVNEGREVSGSYDRLLRESVENSREGVSQTVGDSLDWLESSISATNSQSLNSAQRLYLTACANISAKEHLSIKQI